MVALNFNASTVEPQAALEPLPTGQYPVIITATEEKPTRAGDGSYLEIEMTITNHQTEPKLNGRKVYDRLNIRNKNQTAVNIAYSTLSAICHVTGMIQLQDSSQLHGRPFIAVVIKKKRDDQPELFTNEVRGYKDINGNDPGKGGMAPAQQQAAPNWAAQPQGGQPAPAYAPQQAPQAQPQPVYAPQQQMAPTPAAPPAWGQQAGQQPAPIQQAPQPVPVQQAPVGPAGAAPSAPSWAR